MDGRSKRKNYETASKDGKSRRWALFRISSTALNDLALGNLIDTGQTSGPDFKRSELLPLPLSSFFFFSTSTSFSFLSPSLPPLPSFVRVVGRLVGRSVGWKSVSRGGGQREDDEVEEAAERSRLPATGDGHGAKRSGPGVTRKVSER